MDNSSTGHYCLICFTKFKGPHQIRRRASQTKSDPGGEEETPELFRKFLLFSQQYLTIPRGGILPFVNGRRGSEEGREVFCDNCGGVVDSICRLYKELCQVQLQLAWKLGQLGELIEIANGGGGGVGGAGTAAASILEKLGSQLEVNSSGDVGGGKAVQDLRTGVALQCDCQFRNGQKLEGILSAQSNSGGSCDNPSIGISCDVEVIDNDVKEDARDNANLESQYFIEEAIGKTSHFLCDQSSSAESALLGQATGKKVECHECHRTFAHKYSLEKHLRTQHAIETTFSCSECNLEFHTRQQHHQHQNEYHYKRKPEGQGQSQGGSGSGSSSSPRKKVRRAEEHDDNKLHKCCECGNRFSSSSLLMDHMHAHTKNKQPNKKTTSSKVIRRLIPPGWKECPDCHEGLPPSAFYYHVRRVHGQGPRHVCPEPGCGKEFLFPTGLKRHLLHHGEKRFECPICQKKFSQFPTLKRHAEGQHGHTLEIDKCQQRNASPPQQSPPSTSANFSNYSGGSGGGRSNDSGNVPFQLHAYPQAQPPHAHVNIQQQQNQIVGGQRWVFVPSWQS